MAVADVLAEIQEQEQWVVRPREPMSAHVPLRLGGPAESWIEAPTPEALNELLGHCRTHGVPWRVHWPFSDWIVRDGGVKGVVIRPGVEFEKAEVDDSGVWVGGALPWAALISLGHPIARWSGCPGSLVHSPDFGALDGLVDAVRWIVGGTLREVPVDGAFPEPGKTAVLVAVHLRSDAVPEANPPSSGALFANPDDGKPAAEYLSRCRVPGTRLRQWRFANSEPGTVVQLGEGSHEDLKLLVQGVKARVEKDQGVQLEQRIPELGERPRRSRRGRRRR